MNPSLQNVIWIRLEKPSFDLIGVVLSSFGITGICIGVAVALGACWGAVLIRRGRGRVPFEPDVALGLNEAEAR
jgi:hypothetical protein